MPQPIIRVIDGVKHVWTPRPGGGGEGDWIPSGGGGVTPRTPFISLPPQGPSGRTDADDRATATRWLKNILMTGGMIAGGEFGVPAMLAGSAIGRMIGHVPEAAVTATTGKPNDSSFLGEGATGAMDAAEAELVGRAAGPVLRYGGKGLKVLGRTFGDNPASSAWTRAKIGSARTFLAREAGMPGWAAAAAGAGPPIASELGRGLEAAGEFVGGKGASARIRGTVDALKERFGAGAAPAVSRAETMARGAEDFAAGRRPSAGFRPGTAAETAAAARADALEQAANARGSGVTAADIRGDAIPVQARPPETAVGFEPAPPGAGDFPTNAELVRDRAVQRRGDTLSAVDKIVADPATPATRETNAALVQSLTDAGVPLDAANEAVYGVNFSGRPGSVESLRTATGVPAEPGIGGATDLTADELVTHYAGGEGEAAAEALRSRAMTSEQLDAAFEQMKAQNAARRAAETGEPLAGDATDVTAGDAWRPTSSGFDVDLTGPTVVGGPATPAAPAAPATPAAAPPAAPGRVRPPVPSGGAPLSETHYTELLGRFGGQAPPPAGPAVAEPVGGAPPSAGPAGVAENPNLRAPLDPAAQAIRDQSAGAYEPSVTAEPTGLVPTGGGAVVGDVAPQDAVAELARRFNSKSEGEMIASRLFKGNLDNEFADDAAQVTIPEEHLPAALEYLRNRLAGGKK